MANHAAVAVENALAFQEIETLKDKLAKEKAYLEEEVRTKHNFGDVVSENRALREVLKLLSLAYNARSWITPISEKPA